MKKPLILIIMDGWGISHEKENNAVWIANTPNMNRLYEEYQHCELQASGSAVGLPDGQMGNSEVGHLNIGAGRVVYQDISLINNAINTKTFFDNSALNELCKKIERNGSSLHIMGLLSDGGVHSHINHLFALLALTRRYKLKNIFIHAFLDGRDTPPESGHVYLQQLLDYIKYDKNCRLATMSGRYYAMDRDNRWERVKMAYDALLTGNGRTAPDLVDAIKKCYECGETDEFIMPTVLKDEYKGMEKEDGIVFFNFRGDRAREITRAFTQKDFNGFDASNNVIDSERFICFTEYDEKFHLKTAFGQDNLVNILGETISKEGLSQLRIAETEKYAHVTFFFNGGEERPFPNEDRALIPSPKEVATYDKKPEMSAYAVTKEALSRIRSGKHDFIVLNYANADMVGHTGIMPAAVKACEVVDECVGELVKEILEHGGEALITADHGNAEKMFDNATNMPYTAHTTNPVPFIAVSKRIKELRDDGILADIAPTILALLKIKQPIEMTGKSLIKEAL